MSTLIAESFASYDAKEDTSTFAFEFHYAPSIPGFRRFHSAVIQSPHTSHCTPPAMTRVPNRTRSLGSV